MTENSSRRKHKHSDESKLEPLKWSTEDVIKYITTKDPSMGFVGDIFKKHSIDGHAFMLLSKDDMIKYMKLNLGTSLKLEEMIFELYCKVDKSTEASSSGSR